MGEHLKTLQKAFKADDIEWRVSHAVMTKNGPQALVLAYVTNRAIMERLDETFGIAGWKNEYREWREKGVLCTITCKVGDEWIAKSDGADESNMEATKGGFSNSMKRAAVQWGIGRYLYNLEANWAKIEERGQNFINTKVKVNNKEEWVKGYWNTPKLPKWALPEGYAQSEPKPQLTDEYDEPNVSIPVTLKAKYQTGKGSIDGFEDWVTEQQAKGRNYKDMEDMLTAALMKKTESHSEIDAFQAETKRNNDSAVVYITESQRKLLIAKWKQSKHNKLPQADILELISAEINKQVTGFEKIEKGDINKVIKWLDEQKAA